MPNHADFRAAIIADKASDTPRLIYADWLEEQGDTARADFIRVQCELATLPPARPVLPINGYVTVQQAPGPTVFDDDSASLSSIGSVESTVLDTVWHAAGLKFGDVIDLTFNRNGATYHIFDCRVVDFDADAEERYVVVYTKPAEPDPHRQRRMDLRGREAELWGSYPDVNDLRQHLHASMPAVAEPMGWCILPQGYNDFGNHTPSAVVRRGFVAHVKCDLATWLTVGPRLVATQPVESVELSDKVPTPDRSGNRHVWENAAWPCYQTTSAIPPGIFTHLDPQSTSRWIAFNSRDVAVIALSHALIAAAKPQT